MRSNGYRRYALALLTILVMFNFVDRFALGVVLEDIKRDLNLRDTQLGLLTGIAFALFYSVMGIPIARWADRGNRVTIISVTAALWSAAVALCGVASNFVQLLLMRMGVAVGEAGGFSPGLSLISDYFNRSERPRAVAIYTLGSPLSAVVGYLVAGWLSEHYGWRVMFVVLGAPGVLLAIIARATLKETRGRDELRGLFTRQAPADRDPESGIGQVCLELWANRTFRHLLLGNSISFFFIYGILQWQPTFFIRSYGFTSVAVGTAFAAIYGLGGLVGTYCGGELAARYAQHNEALQLRGVALVMSGSGVASLGVYLAQSAPPSLVFLGIAAILQFSANGPLYAALQTAVPQRQRAVSMALVLFIGNLIGMGFGPLATGILSDALRPIAGGESLRYALLVLCPGYLWVGSHFWQASRTIKHDIGLQT